MRIKKSFFIFAIRMSDKNMTVTLFTDREATGGMSRMQSAAVNATATSVAQRACRQFAVSAGSRLCDARIDGITSFNQKKNSVYPPPLIINLLRN